jgi:hypothetical protein
MMIELDAIAMLLILTRKIDPSIMWIQSGIPKIHKRHLASIIQLRDELIPFTPNPKFCLKRK